MSTRPLAESRSPARHHASTLRTPIVPRRQVGDRDSSIPAAASQELLLPGQPLDRDVRHSSRNASDMTSAVFGYMRMGPPQNRLMQ